MLWWFLILAVSTGVVVLVAVSLYLRVRRQMKRAAAGEKPEFDDSDE
ncbi:MAG: hypothetical protein LAO56_11835 [Acidobacteriia bacterium]|nr:hypothetical protein [Terriglobia bacterium]